MKNADLIHEYYTAVGNKDFEKVEKFLAPNVQFIGPLAQLQGKKAVLEATKNFAKAVTD